MLLLRSVLKVGLVFILFVDQVDDRTIEDLRLEAIRAPDTLTDTSTATRTTTALRNTRRARRAAGRRRRDRRPLRPTRPPSSPRPSGTASPPPVRASRTRRRERGATAVRRDTLRHPLRLRPLHRPLLLPRPRTTNGRPRITIRAQRE